MFKDYNKFLWASLRVYLFLLVCCFILKLVGIDYLGLDTNNATLVKASNYMSATHWGDLYWFTTVFIQFYLYLGLVCNKRKLFIPAIIGAVINYSGQIALVHFGIMSWAYEVWCILIALVIPMIVNKSISVKAQIKYIALIILYQLISMFVRNVGINENYNNFLLESLLNIDQLLMLAITYNIHFMKGGSTLCGVEVEAGSSLQKKSHYLHLLEKFRKNYSNFKKLDKQEKATIIIYSILSLIWNIFTLVVILFIAKLNDTFVECLFIITSFWLSKRIFGKPFHLKSMLLCFVLSNITYYVLNRITTPTGISILMPIMLGVGLSYITSKLVKKTYRPLYKGMPEEEFKATILKVVAKDSDKYKICYDYFVEKQNAIYLSHKYNYTEAGIRKITGRVNDSIKALE